MCISKPYRSITFIFICSARFRYVPTLISQKLIIRNQFHHTYFGKWQKVRVEKAKQNLIFTPEENSAWFLKRMPKVRSSTSGHQYPPSLAASKACRGKILKMKVRRVTKSGAPKIDGSTTRITFHTMYRNGFQRPCTWLTWASFDFRDAAPQRNYNFSIFSTFFGYHSATPKSSFPRICNIVRRYLGIRNDTSSKQMVACSAFSISLSRPTNALSGNLENGP